MSRCLVSPVLNQDPPDARAVFFGFSRDPESGDIYAVVRFLDSLLLDLVHVSRVKLVDDEWRKL